MLYRNTFVFIQALVAILYFQICSSHSQVKSINKKRYFHNKPNFRNKRIIDMLLEEGDIDVDFYNSFQNERKSMGNTFYPSLKNFYKDANMTQEAPKYKWITRIIENRELAIPHVCTGVCIYPRIVISSVRCILGLTPQYMRLVQYDNTASVLVVVMPVTFTKQAHGDIAVIVADNRSSPASPRHWLKFYSVRDSLSWSYINNLTDGARVGKKYKAIGYGIPYEEYINYKGVADYKLVELDVTLETEICQDVYSRNLMQEISHPCYHSCTYAEYKNKHKNCQKYLGIEGAALYDPEDNTLVGIASWGFASSSVFFPVGIAIPNSVAFWQNYKCARHLCLHVIRSAVIFRNHHMHCIAGCQHNMTKWYPGM